MCGSFVISYTGCGHTVQSPDYCRVALSSGNTPCRYWNRFTGERTRTIPLNCPSCQARGIRPEDWRRVNDNPAEPFWIRNNSLGDRYVATPPPGRTQGSRARSSGGRGYPPSLAAVGDEYGTVQERTAHTHRRRSTGGFAGIRDWTRNVFDALDRRHDTHHTRNESNRSHGSHSSHHRSVNGDTLPSRNSHVSASTAPRQSDYISESTTPRQSGGGHHRRGHRHSHSHSDVGPSRNTMNDDIEDDDQIFNQEEVIDDRLFEDVDEEPLYIRPQANLPFYPFPSIHPLHVEQWGHYSPTGIEIVERSVYRITPPHQLPRITRRRRIVHGEVEREQQEYTRRQSSTSRGRNRTRDTVLDE